MSSVPAAEGFRLPRIDRRFVPLAVTISLFVAMAVAGSALYDGFLSPQVFLYDVFLRRPHLILPSHQNLVYIQMSSLYMYHIKLKYESSSKQKLNK